MTPDILRTKERLLVEVGLSEVAAEVAAEYLAKAAEEESDVVPEEWDDEAPADDPEETARMIELADLERTEREEYDEWDDCDCDCEDGADECCRESWRNDD